MPIRTHGLTHLNLAVQDPDRSLRFFVELLGVREYYRDANSIQVQGPGSHDVIAFERDPDNAGKFGGGKFAAGLPGYEIEIWFE